MASLVVLTSPKFKDTGVNRTPCPFEAIEEAMRKWPSILGLEPVAVPGDRASGLLSIPRDRNTAPSRILNFGIAPKYRHDFGFV